MTDADGTGPAMRCRLRFERDAAGSAPCRPGQIKELRALVAGSGLEFHGSRGTAEGVPKMAFGPAAGAGHLSLCEYADAWFARRYGEEELRLALPGTAGGLRLTALRRVPLLFPSIEASAAAARYELRFAAPPPGAEARLSAFMSAGEVWAERIKNGEKMNVDIRAAVVSARWDPAAPVLDVRLKLRGGGRPESLAAALFGEDSPAPVICRRELYWADSGGALRDILGPPRASAES